MRFMEALTKLVVGMSRVGDHLLQRKVSGIVVAALAFACGAGLVCALRREPAAETKPAPPVGEPEESEFGSPELQAWKNRHGGAPLFDNDLLSSPPQLSDSKVVVLPSGRILALAGGDLHMLDANRRIVWRYDTPHDVENFLHVKATGVIYITDDGNNMFVLDAATGRVLGGEPRGGRAWYGTMLPYGEDTCLVMDELGSYRLDYVDGPEPMQDGVTAWRGTDRLWHRDVPPDAELQVVGKKIYAVTKTKDRILLKELRVPRGTR